MPVLLFGPCAILFAVSRSVIRVCQREHPDRRDMRCFKSATTPALIVSPDFSNSFRSRCCCCCGSHPDVSRAVEVMVAEVSMFEEIMEKINALVTEFWEYKEQNDLWLQQHEEALQLPSIESLAQLRKIIPSQSLSQNGMNSCNSFVVSLKRGPRS